MVSPRAETCLDLPSLSRSGVSVVSPLGNRGLPCLCLSLFLYLSLWCGVSFVSFVVFCCIACYTAPGRGPLAPGPGPVPWALGPGPGSGARAEV